MAAVADGKGGWLVLGETGRRIVASPLGSELIRLVTSGEGDEDHLVEALSDRFSPEEVYYGLIQLEKIGVITAEEKGESPEELFREKVLGKEQFRQPLSGNQAMTVRILSVGGMDETADSLAASLSRSGLLRCIRVKSDQDEQPAHDGVYMVVTPDMLEPALEAFGRRVYERRLTWLVVKPHGVIPLMGPLFVPEETGCVECLLDRVRGHNRLEVREKERKGEGQSLRLSAGHTTHSLEVVAGLLATELEKLAAGGRSALVGAVLTLDFRTLELTRHPLVKRPQCPVCGTIHRTGVMSEGPVRLEPRPKGDHRDGGERVCSAMETLEKYAGLVSPVTGIVGRVATLSGIPSCFGPVVRTDWIIRRSGAEEEAGSNGRVWAVGTSTGKGRTLVQARASALGEAVERYCSQYEGYEYHVRAPFGELGDRAIHPYGLMGFSERQYTEREKWREKGETSQVPEPYDPTRPIDWTPAWSLTRRQWRLIPSAFVYYSYPRGGGGDICYGCSNGVAAGNCLEEAVMQGFYELVERDGAAMWWYHKLRKPALDVRAFGSSYADRVAAAMDGIGMVIDVLDLTHDLGIPVFAANLFDANEGHRLKSIGLGCHRDPVIALERALAEMGQLWGAADPDTVGYKFQETPLSREPFLRRDPCGITKGPSGFTAVKSDDFLQDIEASVELLRSNGLEMLMVDLTRPDIGFPVVRVIVPGLVHFWPRFGCRRLFEVPARAGWIARAAGEDSLNPVPFYL